MKQPIKIVIPIAGYGSRMRPQTWSKPKPLIHLAGKTILDHILDQFSTLPDNFDVEYVFIVSPHQLEQIQSHMQRKHPDKVVHLAVQEKMRGQSDALYLAREFLNGSLLICFSDTLAETNLAFLATEPLDGVAWVKPVEDPRRFGVAELGKDKIVTRLIEKPTEMENNLVVIGFYYLRSGEALLEAIEIQRERNVIRKGEFFLTDALNIFIERGGRMRTETAEIWLDAGLPDALLETNRYLLSHGRDNSAAAAARLKGVAVIPPVYIPDSALVETSVVGPYVSLGENVTLKDVVISNSILEDDCAVRQTLLEGSIIGRQAQIQGKLARLNVGDNSWVAE